MGELYTKKRNRSRRKARTIAPKWKKCWKPFRGLWYYNKCPSGMKRLRKALDNYNKEENIEHLHREESAFVWHP